MNKTKQYRDLLEQIDRLEVEIMNSDEYIDLVDELERIEGLMDKMKEPIVNLKVKADEVKSQIIEEGSIDTDIAEFKYKVSKEVDAGKLYSVVGDIDQFVSMVSVTQKTLKELAKENPDIKKPLLGCIVEKGKTITGINIL